MENVNNLTLNLFAKTWTRDSNGLFDYESLQVKPVDSHINEDAFFIRKKTQVKCVKSKDEITDEEFLFKIRKEKSK